MFNTDGDKEDHMPHMPRSSVVWHSCKRPDIDAKKIARMGLSYGALLSLYAGTEWAHQRYQAGGHRYAAIAPLYRSAGWSRPMWTGASASEEPGVSEP